MNSTGKILVGVAAGMTAGAILGVLFAPGKGSETRRKMQEQKNKLSDGLIKTFAKGKGKLTDLTEGIGETMKDMEAKFS